MFNVALLIISASHKNSEQQFSTVLKLIVKESLVKVNTRYIFIEFKQVFISVRVITF
tara:strand:+ start:643 stop:813 length:171 start_codon:yes stop_codon:yes gene_type:complete